MNRNIVKDKEKGEGQLEGYWRTYDISCLVPSPKQRPKLFLLGFITVHSSLFPNVDDPSQPSTNSVFKTQFQSEGVW